MFLDTVTLEWEGLALSGADTFNVYRGPLGMVGLDYGSCLQSSVATSTVTDAASPPAGTGWLYVVTGSNTAGEGPMGTTSAGPTRPNYSACP